MKTNKREGIRKEESECTQGEVMTHGANMLSTALILTLPEEMRSSNMKARVFPAKYLGTGTTTINGQRCQYEEYDFKVAEQNLAAFKPFGQDEGMEEKIWLYYDHTGKLIRFRQNDEWWNVIESSCKENTTISTVPSGYKIFADNSKNMQGLLQEKVLLEQH